MRHQILTDGVETSSNSQHVNEKSKRRTETLSATLMETQITKFILKLSSRNGQRDIVRLCQQENEPDYLGNPNCLSKLLKTASKMR